MALFEYAGFNDRGRKVSGTVESSGRRAAMQQLRAQGIVPVSLEPQAAAPTRRPLLARLSFEGRVPVAELAAATRQLATLLKAGIPLDETLATVASQQDHPTLGKVLSRIREDVREGSALNDALRSHSRTFPDLFINMVAVGEASGTLDQVLHRLADFLEDQARLRSRIQAAMAYPVLMALIGSGVLLFLMTFVVPKITRMIADLGQALPLPTKLLIGVTDLLANWWWLALVLAAAIGLAAHRSLRSEAGRLAFDRWKLTMPLFGRLNLLLATARFSRTLGTLLKSGVPMLTALEIVRNLMPNTVLRRTLDDTIVAVREGEGLAAPLLRSSVFPKMVPQMAAVGEKSGELEEMLFRVADAYEHQVDTTITALLSLLEPLMILFMGAVVGFIVLAILLPIFQASQGIG